MSDVDFEADFFGILDAGGDAMALREFLRFDIEERDLSAPDVYHRLLELYERTERPEVEDALQDAMSFLTGDCAPGMRLTDAQTAMALRREAVPA